MRLRSIWLSFFSGLVLLCPFVGQVHASESFQRHLGALRVFTADMHGLFQCVSQTPPRHSPCFDYPNGNNILDTIAADLSAGLLDTDDHIRLGEQLGLLTSYIFDISSGAKFSRNIESLEVSERDLQKLRAALSAARERTTEGLRKPISDLQYASQTLRSTLMSLKINLSRRKSSRTDLTAQVPVLNKSFCDFFEIQDGFVSQFSPPESILSQLLTSVAGIDMFRLHLERIRTAFGGAIARVGEVSPNLSLFEILDLTLLLLRSMDAMALTKYEGELEEMKATIKVRNQLVGECHALRLRLENSR